MTEERYSLRELSLMFGNTTPGKIKLAMILANTHEERLRQVEAAIDWVLQEHTKTRQHRYTRSEDALTVDIITDLKAMCIDASHDTDYGGHTDIVIEARDDFLWMGEAKIHSDYDWLFKGFQQLDTRYSTGLPGQDHGGIIIYCRGKRADQVMDRWCEHLPTKRSDVVFDERSDNPLVRRSTHIHQRTGRQFGVRHTIVSIDFDPQDK